MKKPRRYHFGYNLARSRFDGTADEFDELFICKPRLEGDVYDQDTDAAHAGIHNHFARRHGNYGDLGMETPIHHVLTAIESQRLDSIRAMYTSKASGNGILVCDLEQGAGFHSFGPLVPALQTHDKIAMVAESGDIKLYTPKDILYVSGQHQRALMLI